MTSNNTAGVGAAAAAELTVVGSPEATIGGAKLADAAAPRRAADEKASSAEGARATAVATEPKRIKPGGGINAVGPITGEGLANRLAKFTGANFIEESGIIESAGKVLIGINAGTAKLTVADSQTNAIHGKSGFASGTTLTAGVFGQGVCGNCRGVVGEANNGVAAIGVVGESAQGRGVAGVSLTREGVNGASNSSHGVRGTTNGGASVAGVIGRSDGTGGIGVVGEAFNGQTTGVLGRGITFGVRGDSTGGFAVFGQADGGVGVKGISDRSHGVIGVSNRSVGISGYSTSNYGVYGTTTDANFAGVHGINGSEHGRGVIGSANNGVNARGVSGDSEDGAGIYGSSFGGVGVRGDSFLGPGVYGSAALYGVRGEAPSGYAVYGLGQIGVRGDGGFGGYGVVGVEGVGSFAAGRFVGAVEVTGNLSKGGGSFKIDHPLDPANKYLYHSFVESPEMMNIYNGVVTLDANGAAVVTMPDYFEALNRDFRYQLTCIGGFAPVYVAAEVAGNQFKIAGGAPGLKVSWQLTGVRQDAFANKHRIPVEETKSEAERGHYLHPAAFNQPEEKSIEWARHPEMMKRMKAESEQTRKPRQ